MTSVLIILQILLVVAITIAVLLQKSSSIGLGAYSGSNESLFGAKGPAGFLAKFTAILGLFLIANTVALSYAYNTATKDSVVEKIAAPQAPAQNSPQIPAAPNSSENASQIPAAPNSSENAPQIPAAPQAPAQNAPQIPAAPQAPSENAPQIPAAPNSSENSPQN